VFKSAYLAKTAELVGGHWFSTPAEGECKGTATPGDGSGCVSAVTIHFSMVVCFILLPWVR
jgi:hypothetical protein